MTNQRTDHRQAFTARCLGDRCPWRWRGTSLTTDVKATEHASQSGHDVRVYHEVSYRILPKPALTGNTETENP